MYSPPQPPPYPPQPPPFGPFYPPPRKPPPDVRSILRLVVFLVSLPALILVVVAIVTFERDKKKDMITFDNRLATDAEVVVDGKVMDTIRPHQGYGTVVKLPPGARHVEVRSGGKAVSGVDLAIPPRGKASLGYRGLYVIGPPQRYVLASVPYYKERPKVAEPYRMEHLGTPTPLLRLPDLEEFELAVDRPFLDSQSSGGGDVTWERHICSYDTASKKVGCSGFEEP